MSISYKLLSSKGEPIAINAPSSGAKIDSTWVPNLRCPHCMHMGAFTSVLSQDYRVKHVARVGGGTSDRGASIVGLRVCPNAECRGLILIAVDSLSGDVVSLPSEVMDFDTASIPAPIAQSLGEAIKCHAAQCYKAAALMVRRVLEELCENRGAAGKTLKDRLEALSKVVVIPTELIEAADHLRLLGNDAAHIEAKTYETIGEEEVRIAIDLTKELLKGAYQYKGLLGRLTALQKAKGNGGG